MKISTGSERFKIRRYEDADEGINLNGVQEHCVGRMDQATRVGIEGLAGLLPLTSTDNEASSRTAEPNVPTGFDDDRRVIPFFDVRLPEGLPFTPRGNGLVPYPLLGSGYVPAKKEVDDDVHLSSYRKESGD